MSTVADVEPTDAQLVDLAKGGDFAAFEELVNRHEKRLYGLLQHMLRNPEEAKDALQTALLQALDGLPNFRGDAAFGTWITRIATNAGLKVIRQRQRRPSTSLEAATEPDADGHIAHPEYIADWRDEPSRLLEHQEMRELIAQTVDTLPEGQRLVFVLRDLEDYSIQETAKALGITPANVKVRLLRARLAIRERLTRIFGNPHRRMTRHDHAPGNDRTAVAELLASYEADGRTWQ